MNDAPLPSVRAGAFSVSVSREGDALVARFEGDADLRARAALEDFMTELHRRTLADKAPRVIMDLHKLEFMNSSCFKSWVTWLGRIQDLLPDQQYRVHFRSNPEMLWQRRSLHALRCLALDLVTIEP
jgi:hypothetical protein